jgi:hypothetical protein
MSGMTLLKGLLINLNQEIQKGRREYLSSEVAYERLKIFTGENFGYDANAWINWAEQNKKDELIAP